MKSLPPALTAHLQSGATTLAWCWRTIRRDGVTLGFTDHDRDLTFDGTTFEAATGFTASEIKDSLGLAVDNLDVESALSSNRLAEADLVAGRYDDARVEVWRVNWQDVTQRVLMRSGSLGEVTRAGSAFRAEIRGLAHYLQQPRGRLYQFACDAELGDARCGIGLGAPAYTATGTVVSASADRRMIVSGLATYETNHFTRGLLTFTSGANAGHAIEVKRHALADAVVTIEVWAAMPQPIVGGDTFSIVAGCDKTFATCAGKFANSINFRGFPHMPGNDFVTSVAHPGDPTNDGSPR